MADANGGNSSGQESKGPPPAVADAAHPHHAADGYDGSDVDGASVASTPRPNSVGLESHDSDDGRGPPMLGAARVPGLLGSFALKQAILRSDNPREAAKVRRHMRAVAWHAPAVQRLCRRFRDKAESHGFAGMGAVPPTPMGAHAGGASLRAGPSYRGHATSAPQSVDFPLQATARKLMDGAVGGTTWDGTDGEREYGPPRLAWSGIMCEDAAAQRLT